MEDGNAIQEYLAEKTGQRTVPSIFISASISAYLIVVSPLLTNSDIIRSVSTMHHIAQYADQKHVGGSDTLVSLQSQGKLAGIIGA